MESFVPSISEQLAKYYVSADTSKIPQIVYDRAKECILDWLGNAIGGASLDTTEMAKRAMIVDDYPGSCTVMLGQKAPADKAAFVNAASAHGLEMDDSNTHAGGHPAVSIITPAFSVAEEMDASGLELMRAVIWGYDTMCRVGMAVIPDNHFERGFHPTSTCGIFGGTTAVSMLKKFNEKQLADALGIAGGFSAGNLECYADGTLTKRINPAHASMGAINAAKLAAQGYGGPRWIFEGKCGFLHAYTDGAEPENMLKNLDYSEYYLMHTAFKPYASCKYTHAPIDSVIKIMKGHSLNPEDVEEIVIDVVSMALRAVVEPKEIKYNPPSAGAAQFSLPYATAVAALFGAASVDQFDDRLLKDPAVKAMMQRVRMVHTGEMDKYLPYTFAAKADIRLKDQRFFSELTTYTKGDPQNPMSPQELKDKFLSLATRNIDKNRALKLYDLVCNLEKVSVRDLTAVI